MACNLFRLFYYNGKDTTMGISRKNLFLLDIGKLSQNTFVGASG
jgi:hypothetical protein